ncbi:MAG TPA: hypothetical protein VEG30_13025 [Terriglobales bacterium]|nr:hypothetical protein [Terriglobales bacterium]
MPKLLIYLLWVAPIVLQVAIAAVIIKRRLYRDVSWFLAYTIAEIVTSSAGLKTYSSAEAYFYTYFAGDAICIVIAFAVIYQLFCCLFRPYPGLQGLGKVLFLSAMVVLLVIASIVASHGANPDSGPIIKGILTVERSLRIVQAGLLLFLFLFSSSLGLTWRHYLFGIALGFGVFATVDLASLTVRTQLGLISADVASLVRSVAFNCAVLVWVVYTLQRDPSEFRIPEIPNHDLQKWDRALIQLLQR